MVLLDDDDSNNIAETDFGIVVRVTNSRGEEHLVFGFREMLKWLSGSSSSGASNNGGNFDNLTHVGKMYTINQCQVVVEEVIAEGMFELF